jgi:YidC/Oxa1 family membrane protein insertase
MIVVPVVEKLGSDGAPEGLLRMGPDRELTDEEEEMPREVAILLQPGTDSVEVSAFWGAKKYSRLADTPWGLERTIDWGWFGFISRPLLWILNWIYGNLIANYGWAVVLTTILIKFLLLPLTHKSHVSMEKMQKLNPKMQAVRQKYRGKLRDKQGRFNADAQRKMNEELQALYKQEGVNPAGGCVPMLLQLPVFFAFFRLLPSAVELRQAPWILWVRDLSAPDPIYLLPILMGASQFWQQKLTPTSADPMQRRIFQLFPFMFTIFAFSFPSGLVLYWLVNNILTMVQIAVYKKLKERKAASQRRSGASKQKDSR